MLYPFRLRHLRKDNNFTQQDIANKLNVSQNAVYNWESGKREPSLEIIEKLAEIYNVSPSYIVGWDEYAEINDKDAEIAFEILKYVNDNAPSNLDPEIVKEIQSYFKK